ncbi:MAG: hypothetical protein WCK37_04695 [Candidatus Falkowbacteria bacterium]
MKNINKLSLLLLLAGISLPAISHAQVAVDPNFNPGNIISDQAILDYSSMNKNDIQRFLDDHNSFLANYFTTNAHGTANKSAAEIIYDAASNNYDCDGVTLSDKPTEDEKKAKCRPAQTVSPKFLLVLAQKEQSLITDTSPQQSQLDWATGYGCPDNWSPNPYYKGFGKQINSAALQFRYYMDHPNSYNFKPDNTYTVSNTNADPSTVTIENIATAGLYNYTPHVYNGNYNFYKLWNKYFGENGDWSKEEIKISYPSGTLLRAASSSKVWLIDNGQKNPFDNFGALISRFDQNKIITVNPDILNKYATGTPIKYPNYSLIKTPDKKIWLLVDDKKRLITTEAVFKKIGFSKDEIINGTIAELAAYSTSTNLTATSTYAYGALIQNSKNGGVYYVSEDTKAPVIDKVLLKTKFKGKTVIKKTEKELAKYTTVAPVIFDDGELLRSNTNPAVYLIDNGKKRSFDSGDTFESLGYKWTNVITVSPQLLALYPNGDAISLK